MPKKIITPSEMDAWQAHLGHLFAPVPMLRPDQIADPLGVDLRTVARLFDVHGLPDERRPWLQGIEFSAGHTGERKARRIPRDNAILFYALSANHTPADVLNLLFDVLGNRSPRELAAIHQRCAELLRMGSK